MSAASALALGQRRAGAWRLGPRFLGPAFVFVVFLLAWQAFASLAGGSAIASPATTLARLAELGLTGDFWADVAETGQAFALSLVIVLPLGTLLGLVLGMNRTAGRVSEPILVNLYSLPKVTLYPVVLLLFGLGMSARVAFGVMHGLIPLCLYAMNAVARMKPVYLRTAQVMRLSPLRLMGTIVWPAILPEIMTGARLAVSLSLLGVLIGEMFASRRGLGHAVIAAMERGDMASVLAVAFLLSAVAVLMNAALLALERARRR